MVVIHMKPLRSGLDEFHGTVAIQTSPCDEKGSKEQSFEKTKGN